MSSNARYDDLNTPLIAVVGFVSAILVFVSIVGFQAVYYYFEAGIEEQKAAAVGPTEYETVLAEQRGKLTSYGWVDREKGQVAIPIDRAMTLVLREQKSSVAGSDARDVR